MKSKKFYTLYLLFAIAIAVIQIGVGVQYFGLPSEKLMILDGVVLGLFFLTSLMLLPVFKGDTEGFVMRFMALTTIQFLSGLAILFAIIYTQMDSFKMIALNTMGFFLLILFLQSILLLSAIRR